MLLLDPSFWEIKETVKKGKGVFAKKHIKPGTVISDYLGTVINPAKDDTSEKEGTYLMYYHDYASIVPADISKEGAHLINHSCMPNCWIKTYYGHTLFFSLRTIHPGEEVTIAYLFAPKNTCFNCTHTCHCETAICTGTMHLPNDTFDRWQAFADEESQRTKRKRIVYHKPLKRLQAYPSVIPDHPIYDMFGSNNIEPDIRNEIVIPSIAQLRRLIRQTGKQLVFPNMHKHIIGIQHNKIVYKE